ncbi:MAG TPA: hypothetical protein VEK34_11835 [Methylocella sp.]|nr:hypothetical protein [Methylocella sp.]
MSKCLFCALLALSFPALAQAASVTNSTVGCKAEADAQKVLGFMAKNDSAGLEKFKASKITAGDCSMLLRGMTVAPDKTDGQFMCVRPAGAFECIWVTGVAINLTASEPDKSSGSHSQGQGRGRGGGGHSQF